MTRTKPVKRKKMKRAAKSKPPRNVVNTTRSNGKIYGSYQPWMVHVAAEMVGKFGARLCDLATTFEVAECTVDGWIKNKPAFANAVKKARLESMTRVAQSMYEKAIGYSHPDTHIISNRVKDYDEDGNLVCERTEALLVPIIKHYPPDAYAGNKLLTILARAQGWAEVSNMNVNHQLSGDINIHKVEELSMDNLSEEIKAMLFEVNLKQLSDVQLS